jgi:hypothetical protein
VNVDSVARAAADRMAGTPGVRRVFTPATLKNAPTGDPDARLCRNALPNDFGWLTCGFVGPDHIWSPDIPIAMHGSAKPEDQSVPIAFLGAGIPPRRLQDTVSTTDIAPTLAALLGIRPGERLDGRPLRQIGGGAAR